MYRHLLLAAALGACAILPAPASAHGHAPGHPNVVSAFDLRIILHDGPKFVDHRYSPRGHLRTQPWPPRFKHHAGRPRWHQPPRHHERNFWFRDHGQGHHFKWSRDNGRHRFHHGQRERWGHPPARDHRRNRSWDRHHRR